MPIYDSSNPAFLMMYSTFKLNKQNENVQPWRTPFPILNQSIVPCPVLTFDSWHAYRVHKEADKVVCYSHLFMNFPQFVAIPTVKRFSLVNETVVDVFLEFSCFFYDATDVGNLTSGSFAFSKSSFNIWKFSVHVLLKLGLEKFEYYFATIWDECNCVVAWTFFGTAFLWDWNENWPFLVLWPRLSFPHFLAYWMQHFHSIIF